MTFSRSLAQAVFAVASALTFAHAAGPNPNVKYFGYDWIDIRGKGCGPARMIDLSLWHLPCLGRDGSDRPGRRRGRFEPCLPARQP